MVGRPITLYITFRTVLETFRGVLGTFGSELERISVPRAGLLGRRAVVATALIVATACSPQGPTYEVRQADGAEIVTITGIPPLGRSSSVWHVDLESSVALDGETTLEDPLAYDPRTMAPLPDGGLLVVDGGPRPFLILGPDGRLRRRFGAWGQGPREVNSGSPPVWVAGDSTIVVVDDSNRKILRYSLGGHFLSEAPLGLPEGRKQWHEVIQETGEYFAHVWFVDRDDDGYFRSLGDSVRRLIPPTDPDVPSIPMPPRVEDPPEFRGGAWLLGPRQVFDVLADATVVTGRNDSSSLAVYRDGRRVRTIDLGLGQRPVGELDHREILQGFGRVAGQWADMPGFNVGIAERFPLFTRLHTMGDSIIVVEHSRMGFAEGDPRPPEESRAVRLISVTGHYLGEFSYPEGFSPRLFRESRVVGVRLNETGMSWLETYRLSPP